MNKTKRFGRVALRLLVIVPLVLTFVAGAVMLSACNMATFEVSENLKAKVDECVSYLSSNVYNSSVLGKGQVYSLEELREKKADAVYFVDAGKVGGVKEVSSVTIGDITFDKDQTFQLSIGNSNYIEDKAFYVEDERLYLATPFVAFETAGTNKIAINGKEFDLNLSDKAEKLNFTNVKFQTGSTNTVQKVSEFEYNLSFNNATTWLGLYYNDAKSTDVALTRKMLNGELNGYGLTATENATNYPIALYPVGYKTNIDEVNTKFDNATMDYSAYIQSRGVAEVKLHLNVQRAEA